MKYQRDATIALQSKTSKGGGLVNLSIKFNIQVHYYFY